MPSLEDTVLQIHHYKLRTVHCVKAATNAYSILTDISPVFYAALAKKNGDSNVVFSLHGWEFAGWAELEAIML